jgi:hypothetical protein
MARKFIRNEINNWNIYSFPGIRRNLGNAIIAKTSLIRDEPSNVLLK